MLSYKMEWYRLKKSVAPKNGRGFDNILPCFYNFLMVKKNIFSSFIEI